MNNKASTPIPDGLTLEMVAELKESFLMFDKDGNGLINPIELQQIFHSLGQNINTFEVEEMMKEMDTSGKGVIDFSDYLTLMSKKIKEGDSKELLVDAFKSFDLDHNGYLTRDELKNVFDSIGAKLTNYDIDQMIRDADIDGDGRIDYEEFVAMIMHTYSK